MADDAPGLGRRHPGRLGGRRRAHHAGGELLKAILLLAALLAVPGAAAFADGTNEGGHERYVIDVFTFVRDNPPSGTYFDRELTLTIPHGYAVQSSTALMSFMYSTTTGSTSSGTWRFTVFWDDVALCAWDIETTSTLTNTIGFPFNGIWCPLTDAQLTPGPHDFRVVRTVQTGAPAALSQETFSSIIERTDLLEPLMPTDFEVLTGLTGTEFFAILALALVCLGGGAFAQQPIARFSAGLFLMLMGTLLLFFTSSAIIVILAAVLLLLGALTFLQVSLEWTRTARGKKQPRRFFE